MSKCSLRVMAALMMIVSLLITAPGALAGSTAPNVDSPRTLEKSQSDGRAPSPVQAILPDPVVQSIISQVTQTQAMEYLQQISGELPVWVDGAWYTIPERYTYSGTPIQKATSWVGQHMAGLGLDVSYHQWDAATNPNVIGEIPGLVNPDQIVIIGGHLDAVNDVPGADDNGSGSIATLMAADILSQYQWGCTVRFAFWTGEEQGLLGSDEYAQMIAAQGEDVLGYLNLDMVAWNTIGSTPGIDLVYHSDIDGSQELAQLFVDVIDAYDLDLVPELDTSLMGGSDHSSFWDQGYNSILAIEDQDDFNPYYHSASDTVAHTDPAYFTEFIKASLGTFVHFSECLIPSGIGAVDGHVTEAGSGDPISGATVTLQSSTGLEFPVQTDVTGYYTRTLISDVYTATAEAYGYLPATITGIPVITDTVTTRDFQLAEAPFHTVSGTVLEAGSGFPLVAEIWFEGSPETIVSNASGYYSVDLPQGSYVMHVSAPSHEPAQRDIVVDQTQTQDFSLLPLPCMLLVDDDNNGPDVRSYYTQALDALGVEYNVWDTDMDGDPVQADLDGYKILTWFTGEDYTSTINPAIESALSGYLDAGGKFFFSSQDYLYDMGLTAFGEDYLNIADFDSDVSQTTVTGANVFAGLGPYSLTYPFDNYSDEVTPNANAEVAFTGNMGNAAVSYDGDTFQTIFLGYPLESVALAGRQAILERAVEFFGGCQDVTGLLEGTVTDASNSAPVQNALITVLPGDFHGQTDVAGDYQLSLPAGTYDVEASAACYLPQMASGVVITASQTTNLDFELDPVGVPTGVDFAWVPLSPAAGITVTFTATVDNPTGLTFDWTISDGGSESGMVFDYVFDAGGVYTVTLSVDNGCGGTVDISHTVTVTTAPAWQLYLPLVLRQD